LRGIPSRLNTHGDSGRFACRSSQFAISRSMHVTGEDRNGTGSLALGLVLLQRDKSLIAIPRIDQVDRCEEEENKLPRAKVIVDSDSLTRALTLTKTARRAHGKF
jgi:hypothetical protein